ncbi:hypothetical protein HQ545_03090 [Candidatus Woesearchaeota archaeon]|nr:hypothetical protein [Candidatus Woesearchaeota archaeon]
MDFRYVKRPTKNELFVLIGLTRMSNRSGDGWMDCKEIFEMDWKDIFENKFEDNIYAKSQTSNLFNWAKPYVDAGIVEKREKIVLGSRNRLKKPVQHKLKQNKGTKLWLFKTMTDDKYGLSMDVLDKILKRPFFQDLPYYRDIAFIDQNLAECDENIRYWAGRRDLFESLRKARTGHSRSRKGHKKINDPRRPLKQILKRITKKSGGK